MFPRLHLSAFVTVALLAGPLAGCADPERGIERLTPEEQRVNAALTGTTDEPVIYDTYYTTQPQQYSLGIVQQTLEEVNGPGTARRGVVQAIEVDDPSPDKRWTQAELASLEGRLRSQGCGEGERCIRFVFLNGASDEPNPPAGFARFEFVYIFPDIFDRFLVSVGSQSLPNPFLPEIERYVVVHELGHVLGLVNQEVPMLKPRLPSAEEDPCQCHSNEDDSPMHYAAHWSSGALVDRAIGTQNLPYRYNTADWQDIRSHQARLRESSVAD